MAEPTRDDVDAIVGPATPHFAYQLRARVLELVEDLPESHEVRRYAQEKAELGAARVGIGYMRNDKAADETAEELRAKGVEPVLVRGNVSSERVAREVGELGPLRALVHNAATGVIRPALETEDKHWDWTHH